MNDNAMILGLGLLAGGAYLYTKKRTVTVTRTAPDISGNPVVDQGVDPGVAPDADGTGVGSGPSFPVETVPESAEPPSGGNTSADALSFRELTKRRIGAINIATGDNREGQFGAVRLGGATGSTGIDVDGGKKTGPAADPLPEDPRDATGLLA